MTEAKNKKKKSGGGSVVGGIASLVMLAVAVAVVVAWARVNNIHDVVGGYQYFKHTSDSARACGAETASWNCKVKIDSHLSTPGSGPTVNLPTVNLPSGERIASHLRPAQLTPIVGTLDHLKAAPAAKVAYKRSEWKHWVGYPCDTRAKVLKSQGKNVKTDPATCRVLSGTWVSPYDNKTVTNPRSLDIDHVIPLGYAAAHGGQAWNAAKKQQFANDTSQLLAVTAHENRSKGDSGPADYMPRKEFRCAYSQIWVRTAAKYGVSISSADKSALRAGLLTCKG